MQGRSFETRVCENPDCGLRYPRVAGQAFGVRCPACLGATRVILTRSLPERPSTHLPSREEKFHLSAMLDNLRSAWNVGSIFRTADGLGVHKLYLCGITPTPENDSVRKTALGAEESVAWEHAPNAVSIAEHLRADGYSLVGLEGDQRAVEINALGVAPQWKVLLIVGNEITGVDPHLLDICHHIVRIPMLGRKRSLNVEVAFGIAAYQIRSTRDSRSF